MLSAIANEWFESCSKYHKNSLNCYSTEMGLLPGLGI